MSEVLVSPEYQAEQERMHREIPEYGVACLNYVGTIASIINERRFKNMLDYGAGKGRIVPAIANMIEAEEFEINLYDPGIPQIAKTPEPAELVTCIDVLEHVEPQYTLSVLHDLQRVTQKLCFITIGMVPASKILSDGRNAHINLRTTQVWMLFLLDKFQLVYAVDKGHTLIFVGRPK